MASWMTHAKITVLVKFAKHSCSGIARSLVLARHLLYTSPLALCKIARYEWDKHGPLAGHVPNQAQPSLRHCTVVTFEQHMYNDQCTGSYITPQCLVTYRNLQMVWCLLLYLFPIGTSICYYYTWKRICTCVFWMLIRCTLLYQLSYWNSGIAAEVQIYSSQG